MSRLHFNNEFNISINGFYTTVIEATLSDSEAFTAYGLDNVTTVHSTTIHLLMHHDEYQRISELLNSDVHLIIFNTTYENLRVVYLELVQAIDQSILAYMTLRNYNFPNRSITKPVLELDWAIYGF